WNSGAPGYADPMIEYLVGERKTNETSDVYLLQALLTTIYSVRARPRGVPTLPTVGAGWDDLTLVYVMAFQGEFVRQKKPNGIVSPPPPTFSFATALRHKFTIAYLNSEASFAAAVLSGNDFVTYLKKKYPYLIGPFRRMRKGNLLTRPASVFEDA